MSVSPVFRKVRSRARSDMPNSIAITPNTVSGIISDCLTRNWGTVKSAAKALARVIDSNERTASNLLEGRNAPSAALLIRLMKHDDAVFEAVLQMAERDLPPAQEQIKAIKAAIAIMEGKA